MNDGRSIKYIVISCFGLLSRLVWCHDIPVHRAITFNAAQSAYASSSAYANFIGIASYDAALKDMTNAMVDGSELEDNINEPGDVGGERSMNHFYDPIHKIGTHQIGLTDI